MHNSTGANLAPETNAPAIVLAFLVNGHLSECVLKRIALAILVETLGEKVCKLAMISVPCMNVSVLKFGYFALGRLSLLDIRVAFETVSSNAPCVTPKCC